MGGAYANQVLIAQLLNAYLPDDVLIYIKEHPRESGWLSRSTEDYEDLLALPKVRFVSRDTSTFSLRERCAAVATVTGTVGFEALFRGKPVFLFGHRFYQYAGGVHRIRTCEDMRAAVRAVFEGRETPTLMQARLYLKAMEDTCVRGVLNPWHLQVSHLNEDEHAHINTQAILRELSALSAEIAAVQPLRS
jgi:capsule polysaccharide export protein KpsC/LpsZ